MKRNIVLILAAFALAVQMLAGELEEKFAAPPDSAKPRTYWFHMSGNISKPGITADLEAMKEIGLGGTLFMNVSVAMPTDLVEKKDFMSPAWQDCFQHMLNESARLKLDFGSALCDGWGNAGGPDIPPALAMQQLTWSETRVRGGETVEVAKIPQPASQLDYYRDIAVLAFPTPPGDQAVPLPAKKNVVLKRPADGLAELRFDFAAPVAAHELTLSDVEGQNAFSSPIAVIEASDDGVAWREVKKFPTSWRGHPRTDLTVAFNSATARHFRVLFPAASIGRGNGIKIAEASLSTKERINYWQAKSAIISHNEHGGGAERFLDAGAADAPGIPLAGIVNLTGKDKWTAPAGDWTVLRVGHTPTGAHNAPATKAGVGLECDKLNPRGIEAQQAAFVDKMLAAATPAAKRIYKHTWIDSWEVGPQNWTANFATEFKARHGYDLIPWLPVLAGGRIVGSRDQSERVLWDFRRTIADLFTENYWKHSMELAHQRGMEFRAESFGRQQFMYDPMNYARACDMPCGEFWVGGGPRVDCKVAASAAHLSGRQIAGAEAFTEGRGRWSDDPWALKTLGDRAFCLGVNQYYFHRYCHQPWTNLVPGMTFGPYGINFERTSTWWKPGKAWVEYLTRCQSLLQQGRFVADAFVMLDEGAPSYGGWREQLSIPLPAGYDYDFANLDALRESRVERGVIVHTNGMRYRVLVLPATGRGTPALLREVLRLAEAGASIAAPRPLTRAPGLTADEEIAALWKKIAATGNVIITENFAAVEKQLGLAPDFAHAGGDELLWIHRTDDAGADWYFVSNQGDQAGDILCTFRVAGRQPELWDAATGETREVALFEERDGRTTVQIPFDPRGSWFVVFRKPASPLAVKPVVSPSAPASGISLPAKSPGVTNTFTIVLRAKPAADIELLKAAGQGTASVRKQNQAILAQQGELMFGVGHVNMGVSVGRNGVAVWEHGAHYLVPRIVAAQPIAADASIAVVYRAAAPTLYINGKVAGTAAASRFIVHPGCPGPFNGKLAGVELIPGALDAGQIAARAASQPVAASPAHRDLRIENGKLIEERELPGAQTLDQNWDVAFQAGRGAPASVHLDRLMDLSRHADEGIRHFSGTMIYKTSFVLNPKPETRNPKQILDLGEVGNLAEVIVNGRNLGVLWKQPFRVDITGALKAGGNELEIRVTDLWANRLIGDAKKMAALGVTYNDRNGVIAKWPAWVPQDAPPAGAPVSFATWRQWNGSEALLPSGLIGPVTLRVISRTPVK
ncbi:MAG: glycosyl hydrolase [Limisphaerales bacterium]